MNLNEFAKEVHQNAVDHGWWGEEYTDAVVIALIQSEITEAFEEWRADRPMLWHRCKSNAPAETVVCERCAKCYYREKGSVTDCPDYDAKPEGIAVELIDVVLRILDAAAAWDVKLLDDYWGSYDPDKFANQLRATADEIVECYTLPELVCELHRMTVELRRLREVGAASELYAVDMSFMVGMVYTWLRVQNLDLEALLLEKHRYNVTRPYKHGNKRI